MGPTRGCLSFVWAKDDLHIQADEAPAIGRVLENSLSPRASTATTPSTWSTSTDCRPSSARTAGGPGPSGPGLP